MKTELKLAIGALALALATVPQARAADLSQADFAPPVATASPFDAAFGITFASQYVARGLVQSNHHPGIQGYGEIRAFDWLYAGAWIATVDFPQSKGLTDPAFEADLYFGVRHTFDRFTFDAGAIYFWYAYEHGGNIDYWEPYFQPSYKVNDWLTLSGLLRATDNFVNLGAKEAYLLGTAKATLPLNLGVDGLGSFVSGSFGHRWIGKTDAGFNFPDYTVWNAGFGLTYKAATLDFRYWDSTLTRRQCGALLNDRGWCGDRYVVSLSFDTTLSKLK